MIHYTCDRCQREIDTPQQIRYVVQVEVQAAIDSTAAEFDDDVDHLSELNQLLQDMSEHEDVGEACETTHREHYDLCPECHRQFVKNPLGRDTFLALGFSNN